MGPTRPVRWLRNHVTSPCITYQILLLSLIFLRIPARWHNMHIRYKLKRFWKKLLVLLPKLNVYLKNPGRIFRNIVHPASCHCPDWWLSWICRRNSIKLTVLLPGYSKTVSILDTQVIPSPSSSALNTRSQRTNRWLHKTMECLWNKWHTQHQLVEAAPCKRMQKGSRFFISISKCPCIFSQILLFLFLFIYVFFVKGRITLQDVASQR